MATSREDNEESSNLIGRSPKLSYKPQRERRRRKILVPNALTAAIPIIVTLIGLGTPIQTGSSNYDLLASRGGCDANNNIYLPGDPDVAAPNRWRTHYFLAITLGFGRFSYTQAKTIDIFWDIIGSRAGQLLLSKACFRVFSKSLLLSMEQHPVRFEKFAAVAYMPTSLMALIAYIKGAAPPTGAPWDPPRRIWTAVALVCATAYVLAFPTFVAAMSGYQNPSTAMVPTTDGTGNMFQLSRVRQIAGVIHDGERLGMSHMMPIEKYSALWNATQNYVADNSLPWIPEPYSCEVSGNQKSTVFMLPLHNDTAEYKAYSLPAPALCIGVGEDDDGLWAYEDNFYTTSAILEAGTCEPQKTYQWGFSLLFVFTFLLITLIVEIRVWAVWLDADIHMGYERGDHVFGTLRAAMEITSAVKDALGDDADGLTDSELKQKLDKRYAGVRSRHVRSLSKSTTEQYRLVADGEKV